MLLFFLKRLSDFCLQVLNLVIVFFFLPFCPNLCKDSPFISTPLLFLFKPASRVLLFFIESTEHIQPYINNKSYWEVESYQLSPPKPQSHLLSPL